MCPNQEARVLPGSADFCSSDSLPAYFQSQAAAKLACTADGPPRTYLLVPYVTHFNQKCLQFLQQKEAPWVHP